MASRPRTPDGSCRTYPSDQRATGDVDPGPARERIAVLAMAAGVRVGRGEDGAVVLPPGALTAVARHLGVSVQSVSTWWRGAAKMPEGR